MENGIPSTTDLKDLLDFSTDTNPTANNTVNLDNNNKSINLDNSEIDLKDLLGSTVMSNNSDPAQSILTSNTDHTLSNYNYNNEIYNHKK